MSLDQKRDVYKCSSKVSAPLSPQHWHMDVVRMVGYEFVLCLQRVKMTYLFVTVPGLNAWKQSYIIAHDKHVQVLKSECTKQKCHVHCLSDYFSFNHSKSHSNLINLKDSMHRSWNIEYCHFRNQKVCIMDLLSK